MVDEVIPSAGGKKQNKEFISATGKRKSAVARIRLYQSVKSDFTVAGISAKKGDTFVNDKKIEDYFGGEAAKAAFLEPFRITNTEGKYLLTIKVVGGGQKGQLDAAIHGVARALASMDLKTRQILKKKGFLTRDARIRERRKVGMGGKARRRKQSPKR
jgi:small subunit ribosomal protein S9